MSHENLQGIVSAMAAAGTNFMALPKMSVSMSPKAVRIEEDGQVAVPHATIFLYRGCVLSQVSDNEYSFSAPYPMIRASFVLRWDGHIRGVSQNPAKRTITIKIDGMPDQTLSY